MKKTEDIERTDISVWLPSGEDPISLYQKLVCTSALRNIVFDSMYMASCFIYDTEFVNCLFKNSKLKENEFRNCKFTNCLFENCKLQEQEFSHCTFNETQFEDCDSLETYFHKSALNSFFFTRGNSDFTMFNDCTIDSIIVTDVTFAPPPPGMTIESLESKSPGLTYLESYVVDTSQEKPEEK